MRYRKLTASGDYSFGHSGADFYVDSPEAVGQSVQTRLLLFQGEWFLDRTEGLPLDEILGAGTSQTYDNAIKTRILETVGVIGIEGYSSNLESTVRKLSVAGSIDTEFGATSVSATIPL